MKRYKEFFTESPIMNDIEKDSTVSPYIEEPSLSKDRKHISSIKDYKVSKLSSGISTHYGLHLPDNRIAFGLTGLQHGNKLFVQNVNSFKSPIKGHEFYHHLITQHNLHIHSDYSLSLGAKKLWENLHKMSGIQMQAYDTSSKEYTNIPKESSLEPYFNSLSVKLAAKRNDI